jgi:methylated-DNA-[protein]-cysteine S-methyltransferase
MKKTRIPATIETAMTKYSAFNQKVWRACAAIPKGEVRTYGWIAEKIGAPGAARAVGTALGKNPFVPIIPCHRVVGVSGLGGYSGRGGLKTKLKLLRKEGVQI